jgi:type III secretion protein U
VSEKTEQPTSHKLRDLRKKGSVAHSNDFTKAVLLVAFVIYLIFAGPGLMQRTIDFFLLASRLAYTPFDSALSTLVNVMLDDLVGVIIPVTVMVVIVVVLANVLQTGGVIIAFEKIKINVQNVDFIKKAQQLFSVRNIVEFIKSLLKVILMATVLYVIVRSNLGEFSRLAETSPLTMLDMLIHTVLQLLIATMLVFILFGAPDLLLQKMLFLRENKMSKDEVFREYKQTEGDPYIKHQRRHLHQEISSSAQQARNASAVVVNPTHVAVALYYVKGETPLPVVLAKGEGEDARDIVRMARDQRIPIVRNIAVARALLADAEVNGSIPHWLVEPVAELLRTVAELAENGEICDVELD